MLGGWGGGNQLPLILKGLNRGLPADIVFSCLNPDLGKTPQPAFLEEIAKTRPVIAVPWLEGDHQLWHYQPRVALMRDHVELAAKQQLHGVVAIHWRTKETSFNFKTFAAFAGKKNDKTALSDLYGNYLLQSCGAIAAKQLTDLFVEMDTTAYQRGSLSPEYYAYTPQWGRLNDAMRHRTTRMVNQIAVVMKEEKHPAFRKELEWFRKTFTFELLLDEAGRCLEPAFTLRAQYFQQGSKAMNTTALREARAALNKAPMKNLFSTFASKIDSRGELGELSALNQKLWTEYKSLQAFLEKMEK